MKAPTLVIFSFSAAILLFGAAQADAQSRSDQRLTGSMEATFKSLDRNRDEALSKIEAKADNSIAAAFATADINLDGYITKSEYMAYLERSTATRTREPPNQ